ncbi:MAG: hypothetical protein K2Z81_22715 [Cyanobacteria bacterium]|nr:hypothetical protein [Cyanobacteriota bacterium]
MVSQIVATSSGERSVHHDSGCLAMHAVLHATAVSKVDVQESFDTPYRRMEGPLFCCCQEPASQPQPRKKCDATPVSIDEKKSEQEQFTSPQEHMCYCANHATG